MKDNSYKSLKRGLDINNKTEERRGKKKKKE